MAVAVFAAAFIMTQLIVSLLGHRQLDRINSKALELARGHQLASVKRVPLTLITGFLGSGKTTLVNHILKSDHNLRILIVENELGTASIDDALIDQGRRQSPPGVVVLKNGCMCCSGGSHVSELERVLDRLLDLYKLGGLPFDYVLIEASGLADPSALVQVRTIVSCVYHRQAHIMRNEFAGAL